MNGIDFYLNLLKRLDCLSNQVAEMQAWNRDLQAQLDQQGTCIRANNAGVANLSQWVGELACDFLDSVPVVAGPLGRRLSIAS